MTERRNFTKSEVDRAWNKSAHVTSADPNKYRQDNCGNVIYKGSYGKDTTMGWNVDHKKPLSKGGSYNSVNLQALQTAQNKSKSNTLNYSYNQGTQRKGISVRTFNKNRK